ncbi:hypothetical protein RND71_022018 [Anisodus tanguticus]|uniref:Uncharacterized protein n=1 Tax=Anisodus tanguticus TaxID=243964 RepID=A0AAE1RWA2_9SOLA|nr:hypothetical protein RND71_022018 [Anisodus tanguticus]
MVSHFSAIGDAKGSSKHTYLPLHSSPQIRILDDTNTDGGRHTDDERALTPFTGSSGNVFGSRREFHHYNQSINESVAMEL